MYAIVRGLQQELARDPRASSADGWYLDALALHTKVDGTLRISLRELAKELDRGISTIRHHVKRLIEFGFVEKISGCEENGRHTGWRIAGMDRSEKVKKSPGDNRPGGARPPRARHASQPLGAREGRARIPAPLPGELIEPTRASPQQEPPPARAGTPPPHRLGVQASRQALERRRPLSGGCDAPGGDSGASRDATDPPGLLGAQNGAEGSAGSLPDDPPRSVADDASRCGDDRDRLPSCSTMNPNPDDYEPDEPEVPDEQTEPPEPAPAPFDPNVDEPAEPPPETATSGLSA